MIISRGKEIICIMFFLFIMASCGIKPKADMSIPTPEPGKATVTGKVISLSNNNPLSDTDVWLANVVRQEGQGIYFLDSVSSPGVKTNEDGIFIIENIDPGEYVIIIGDPEIQYEIISENSGKAKVWNVPVGEIYDVGEFYVKINK